MSTRNKVQAERTQPRLDLPSTPAATGETAPPTMQGPVTKAETFAATLTQLVDIEHAEALLYREKLALRSILLSTADYQLIDPSAVPGGPRRHARADCPDIGSDTWLQNIDLAAAELAAATCVSTGTAKNQLATASYYTHHYAVAVASLDPDGDPYRGMTAHKLDLFTEHTTDLTDTELEKVTARVLPHAHTDTPRQFARRIEKAVIAVTGTSKQKQRRARAAQDRYVAFDSDSITARIFGRLPIACARALDTALDDLARSGALPGDVRTHEQRRIDALAACVLGPAAMIRPAGHPAYGGAIPGAAAWDADGQYLITDPSESAEAAAVFEKIRGLAATINFTVPRVPEVTIKVTIPAHLLAGSDLAGTETGTRHTGDVNGADADCDDSDGAMEAETVADPHRRAVAAIEGLGPIDADLARHLAKDARWQRVITDPYTGAVLDVGTKIYRPPAQMRRRIIQRDHTCRFPGCTRPAERCDVDHIDPHRPDGTGGTTGDCNLIALCRRHHRLKHQTNWRVTLHDDASCEWTSPAGRRYLTYPADTDPPPPPPPHD
ncbi:HNH endonuclease signature motif containing protein [Antricoccus suffuscus]|nr:HNH endonuclease signature motif containing protein [Antricoccus suffuscus]